MNVEGNDVEGKDGVESDDDEDIVDNSDTTVILTEIDDDDDGLSETVVDVDALVAKLESADAEELARKRAAKKRLEQIQEQLDKDDKFGSTYTFDIDEDLPT